MSKNVTDRTIALAGLMQAARQVQRVAREGRPDHVVAETCINSLFITNPERAEDVFGGIANLREGLQLIQLHLGSSSQLRDLELMRYVVGLVHLERKLAKQPRMLQAIDEGLQRARNQAEHFGVTHANVIANLADTYVNTISTMTPRIMISGEHGYLEQADNANLVRALLLAGIRATVLWSQCGGSRWKLILGRGALTSEANRLLGAMLH